MSLKVYFKENEDEQSAAESEEEMPLVAEASRTDESQRVRKCDATATAVSGTGSLALSNLLILNATKSLYYLDKLHLVVIFDPNLHSLCKMCVLLNVHISSFV